MTIRGAAPCALALLLALSGLAAADPRRAPAGAASQVEREAARSLAQQGFAAMDRGDFARAAELFRQADARFHAPTHWLYVARAEDKLGRLLAAAEAYERVLADDLARAAPKVFVDAQASARAELAAVRERTPSLTIEVARAPGGATPEITIDGAPLTAPGPTRLDPGRHVVRVEVAGAPPFERAVDLVEGEQRLLRIPPALAPAPAGSLAPGLAAFGLGAAGLAVGVVAGVLSLEKVDDLEARCPERRCLPAFEPLADDARALGTASTIGFVAGGVLAAAGVILLVVRSPGAPAPEAAVLAVHAGVGPGSILLGGSF